MLAIAGVIVANENQWSLNRYLGEGICPTCHGILGRTGNTAAICCPCKLHWTSPRIPRIFPSDPLSKETTA